MLKDTPIIFFLERDLVLGTIHTINHYMFQQILLNIECLEY